MATGFPSSDIGAFMVYLSESDDDLDSCTESDIVLGTEEDYSRYSSGTEYSHEEEDSDSEETSADDKPGPSSRFTREREAQREVTTADKPSSDEDNSHGKTSGESEQSEEEQEPHAKRAKCVKRKGSVPERKWSNTGRFTPKALKSFDSTQCGIQPSNKLPADAKESEYFTLLFDGELVSHVCKETNKYANALIADPEYKKKAGLSTWVAWPDLHIYCCCGFDGVDIKKTNAGLLVQR